MIRKIRKPSLCLLVLALVTNCLPISPAFAGTFPTTRTMELKYGWGTSSMAEFDYYDQLYPGYLPIADLTFYTDGTFTGYDRQSGGTGVGIYDVQGNTLEITIFNPQFNGVIQYVGERTAPNTYVGTILVNGYPCGNWRGEMTL